MNVANWFLLALPVAGTIALYLALKRHDRMHPLKRRQDQEDPKTVAQMADIVRTYEYRISEVAAAIGKEQFPVANESQNTGWLAKAAAKPAAKKPAAKAAKPAAKAAAKPAAKKPAVKPAIPRKLG